MTQAQGWWVVQANAVLQAVATQNYACYGRGGVPRYDGPQPQSSPPAPDPASLCVEMVVRAPDGTARLANLDVTLKKQEQTAQRTIWAGYDPAQHLQTIWIWDFFRLLSLVVLRVAEPPRGTKTGKKPDSGADSAWKSTLGAIRAISVNDVLALDVRSACGDIHQEHTLTGPATRWKPV